MGFRSRLLRQLRQLPLFMQRRPSLHSVKTKTPLNTHPSVDTDVRSPLSPITEENVSSTENMALDGRLGDQASHGRHSVSFPTPDLNGSADPNANPVREVPATAAALDVQPNQNRASATQQTLHETIDAPINTGVDYTSASLLQDDQFIRVVPSSCFIIPCGHDDYLIRVLRHVNLGDVEFARRGTVKLVAPDGFYEPQIGHCVLVQFGISKYISRVLLKISAEEGPTSEPYRAMDPRQDLNAYRYRGPSPPPSRHSFRPEPAFSDTPMTQSTMRVLHTPARSAFGTPVHGIDRTSQLGGLRRGYVQTDVGMQNPPTEATTEVGDDQLVSSVELMATLNLRGLPSRGELPDRQGEERLVPTPRPLPLSDPRMDISPPSSEDEGPSEMPLTHKGVRGDSHRSPNQTNDISVAGGPSSQFTSPSTSPPISNSSSESITNDEYGYPQRRAEFKSHKPSLHSRRQRGTFPLNKVAILNDRHYPMPDQLPPGFQPFGPQIQSTSSSTQDTPHQSQRGDRRSRDFAVRFSEHSATLGHADTQGVFADTVSDVPASGLWDRGAFFSNVSQRAPEGGITIPLPPTSPVVSSHSNPSRHDAHTPG